MPSHQIPPLTESFIQEVSIDNCPSYPCALYYPYINRIVYVDCVEACREMIVNSSFTALVSMSHPGPDPKYVGFIIEGARSFISFMLGQELPQSLKDSGETILSIETVYESVREALARYNFAQKNLTSYLFLRHIALPLLQRAVLSTHNSPLETSNAEDGRASAES